MIGELKFMDDFPYFYEPLPKFCVERNDHLTAITTHSGILLLQIHPEFEQPLCNVTYYKFFIKPSSYMLIDHIDIDISSFLYELPQDYLYLCLLQSNITGSVENLKKKNFFMNKCSFSPNQLIGEQCVVAAVTDVGALDLYVRVNLNNGLIQYEHLMNINKLHINRINYKWLSVNEMNADELHKEVLRRLSMHSVRVVTWSHMMKETSKLNVKKNNCNSSEYCCLIAAHADGMISFWQMKKTSFDDYKTLRLCFMHEYQTSLENITAICWFGSTVNSGLLIVGDHTGKTIVIPMLNLSLHHCEHGDEIVLTDATDISVDYINVEQKSNHLIVHVIQQAHILMFLLNKNANICQRIDYNCTNFNITAFQKTINDTIVLSTLTGALIELKTSIIDNQLHLNKRQVYIDMDWSKNTLHGMSLSKNNAILSLVTYHNGYNYKGPIKMKVSYFANNEMGMLEQFMKLDRVYDGIDLIETMRVRSLQKKYLLVNELPGNINYDSQSLKELKKLYFVAKISESVFDQVETVTHYNLKPSGVIVTMIYVQLSIYLLKEIVTELKTKGAVSAYKQEVAHISYTHLKDIILSDFLQEHNLKVNYVNELNNLLHDCEDLVLHEDILCKFCEQPLVGLCCPMRHFDNRCAFTMVQLVSCKFRCSLCERFVAEEALAFTKVLSCALCDSPLDTVIDSFSRPYGYNSDCKEDCLSNLL